jgi:hypothetical protein
MPFSSEGEPGTWWLGAYLGNFDEILLLCETDDKIVCLHLPKKVVERRLPELSRDSKGNVKFSVLRHGGTYVLQLGRRGIDLPLARFDPSSQAHLLGADA